MAKIDVVRHLAASSITQEMIDSAYPWAMVWVDQHQSIHFRDWYHHLEESRLQRLQQFGEPQIIPELQGWWTPDIGDTHRIRALIYNERYVHQPDGCNQRQDNPSWLLRGENAVFRYINSFPPITPQSPYQSEGSADIDAIQEDVPMTPTVDTAADDALDIRTEAVPNATAQDPMIATTTEEISADPHDIPLPVDTDEDMSEIQIPTAEIVMIAQKKNRDPAPTTTKPQI